MSILTFDKIYKDVTIAFASFDLDFDEDTKYHNPPEFKSAIFFEMSEDLLWLYSDACGSVPPFNDMQTRFYKSKYEIHKLSAELCMWQYNLCRVSENRLRGFVDLYPEYEGLKQVEHQEYEAILEQVRFDAIETLAFLTAKINEVALRQRCLGIFGV